jgi:hypothetical protein
MENNAKGIGRLSSQATSSLKKGKKHLFGIGINDYKHWARLRNAVNDLDGIVNILTERYDFDPAHIKTLKEDEATRKNIVNTLHNYTDLNVLGEDDSLLIYFSGHGFLDENKDGYWVPVDSERDNIDSFIPNQTIQSKIKSMKCRHVLLISDSCFSGSLTMKGEQFTYKEELVADDLEKRKSRWLITSGGRDETVSDGSGENSPFAEAIISELKHNTKSRMIADELAVKVRSITRSNAVQMPQMEKIFEAGDLGGRFIFNLKDNQKGDWDNRLERAEDVIKTNNEDSNTPKTPKKRQQKTVEVPTPIVKADDSEDGDIFKLSKSSILAGVFIIVILIFMWLFHSYLVQPFVDKLTN